MPTHRRSWLGQGCADQFRAGLGEYSLYMQAPRIRLRAPETTVRESDQQDLKLDERSPCSPSKHAGFRIVQFHDDITNEVPSFTKIVASRTARAATATESCRGARACRRVTFPAFNLLFSFKHRVKHFHGI